MTSNEVLFNGHHVSVVIVTGVIVLGCVLLHYAVFSWLTRSGEPASAHSQTADTAADSWSSDAAFGRNLAVRIRLLFLLDGHGLSQIHGSEGRLDLVYYSSVVYTTLGLGDLIPAGAIRFMTGVEALSGFVLITWSASFTFLEMQKFWKND